MCGCENHRDYNAECTCNCPRELHAKASDS